MKPLSDSELDRLSGGKGGNGAPVSRHPDVPMNP
jgi:hypothetical protein